MSKPNLPDIPYDLLESLSVWDVEAVRAYAEEAVRQALADVITPQPEKERIAEIAATARDTGKDRLAFHIWALVRGLDITPNDSCGYVSPATLRAWMRWNPPC